MPKRTKITFSNKKKARLITLLISSSCVAIILIPLLLISYIPQSGIVDIILTEFYWRYASVFVGLYFIWTGIYSYQIKIDAYVIDVRSSRVILGIFKQPDYIDISHEMLSEFTFFNRSFSCNKTLMLKVKTDSGKKLAKRFNVTFMSKKEEKKITKVLEKIIAKNS